MKKENSKAITSFILITGAIGIDARAGSFLDCRLGQSVLLPSLPHQRLPVKTQTNRFKFEPARKDEDYTVVAPTAAARNASGPTSCNLKMQMKHHQSSEKEHPNR